MAALQISTIPTLFAAAMTVAAVLYLLTSQGVRQGTPTENIPIVRLLHHDTGSDRQKGGQEYDAKIAQWVRDTYYGDNCSVTRRNLSKCMLSSSRPTSTLDGLRKYVIEHNDRAGSGYWATGGGHNIFCPSFCDIKIDHVQTEGCQISENPIKVVVFGDSTAGYLAQGLISTLEKWGFGCSTSREEAAVQGDVRKRNIEYFTVPFLQAKFLGSPPSLYRGRLDKCFITRCVFATSPGQNNTHLAFDVEYISHTNLLETTLRLNREPSNRSEQFSTFTEYVFRYYMSNHRYPHLLVFYAPFHHQKWHSTFSKAAAEIQYVQSMMEAFLPSTTKILWLPAHLECVERTPEKFKKYPRGNALDANQLLHGLNHVLYTTLSSSLKDS